MARTHRTPGDYDHTLTVGETRDIELRADTHPAIGYLNLTADDSKVTDVTILVRRESDGHRATHDPDADDMDAKAVAYRFEADAPGLYRLRLKLSTDTDERLLTPPVTVWVGRQ
jgi:hypothetical protein